MSLGSTTLRKLECKRYLGMIPEASINDPKVSCRCFGKMAIRWRCVGNATRGSCFDDAPVRSWSGDVLTYVCDVSVTIWSSMGDTLVICICICIHILCIHIYLYTYIHLNTLGLQRALKHALLALRSLRELRIRNWLCFGWQFGGALVKFRRHVGESSMTFWQFVDDALEIWTKHHGDLHDKRSHSPIQPSRRNIHSD